MSNSMYQGTKITKERAHKLIDDYFDLIGQMVEVKRYSTDRKWWTIKLDAINVGLLHPFLSSNGTCFGVCRAIKEKKA